MRKEETEKGERRKETEEKALLRIISAHYKTADDPENVHQASEKALPVRGKVVFKDTCSQKDYTGASRVPLAFCLLST